MKTQETLNLQSFKDDYYGTVHYSSVVVEGTTLNVLFSPSQEEPDTTEVSFFTSDWKPETHNQVVKTVNGSEIQGWERDILSDEMGYLVRFIDNDVINKTDVVELVTPYLQLNGY